jgi:hypothetical protein
MTLLFAREYLSTFISPESFKIYCPVRKLTVNSEGEEVETLIFVGKTRMSIRQQYIWGTKWAGPMCTSWAGCDEQMCRLRQNHQTNRRQGYYEGSSDSTVQTETVDRRPGICRHCRWLTEVQCAPTRALELSRYSRYTNNCFAFSFLKDSRVL